MRLTFTTTWLTLDLALFEPTLPEPEPAPTQITGSPAADLTPAWPTDPLQQTPEDHTFGIRPTTRR